MTRLARPGRAVWAAIALLLTPSSAPAAALTSRPNVLLVVAEDLSPRLGSYGDAVAHTPSLDRLAAEGARYTNAFASAGVCAPSRAAIVMGVAQNRFGAGHMRALQGGYTAAPPPDWKAFPELLRRAGYYTVNSGKTDYQMSTHLGGSYGGPSTIWDRDGGVGEGLVWDDFALWRGRAPGQPFFAYLTLGVTHESQVWPTWQLSNAPLHWLLLPMRMRNHARWQHRTDPAAVAVPPYYPDVPEVRADLARHYDNVAVMDRMVGETLAALAADGLAGETVVIFTSDHGDGLPRAKRWLYDSGIRVPLIVRWPGRIAPGSVSDELVSGVDLASTALALAGVPRPPHLEGRVLIGAEREPPPAAVFGARDRMDESADTVRAARGPRFAYIRNLRPELPYQLRNAFAEQMPTLRILRELHAAGALTGAPALWLRARRPAEELYDTESDPHQVRNLAEDARHAGTLSALRGALDAWLTAAPDLGLLPETELRDRFWPGGVQPRTAAPEIEIERGRASLRCPTEGASLAYRIDGGPWSLYVGPFPVSPGVRVEARAVRYGWAESDAAERSAPSS
jgi:N-sulfoglucosamine sulfohydrolase